MPLKKLSKKSQVSKGLVITLVILATLIVAMGIFFSISRYGHKVEQKITAKNQNLQNKILLSNLLKTDIELDFRSISVTEAINLLISDNLGPINPSAQKTESITELTSRLNSILSNFGYDSEKKVWQLALYENNKLKQEKHGKLFFILSQKSELSGLDKRTVEAELGFPSIYETQDKNFIIELVTLED